jgi:hypothetical protein
MEAGRSTAARSRRHPISVSDCRRILMRFTRLQFIGLALSACWTVGATFYIRQAEMPRAQQYAMTAYFTCAERKVTSGGHDIDPCLANVSKDWDDWMNRKWGDIAYVVLLPIASGWLAGFACIRLYRWKKS